METHLARSLVSTSLLVALFAAYQFHVPQWLFMMVVSLANIYDFHSISQNTVEHNRRNLLVILLLFVYASIGGSLLLDRYYHDKDLWLVQVAVVGISDILQYIVGKYYGKTRISPVSPNKTLEGYLGSFLNIILFYPFLPLSSIITWTIVGSLGGVFVSWCKRHLGIKDTSNLLGPHGGWIDRFDGIYMTFLVAALF